MLFSNNTYIPFVLGDEPAGRSKRQKVDKGGRLAALDKFRQLKGKKRKYEVEELDNVYEEVDEKDYSKAVLERQNDDWIVDDGIFAFICRYLLLILF